MSLAEADTAVRIARRRCATVLPPDACAVGDRNLKKRVSSISVFADGRVAE